MQKADIPARSLPGSGSVSPNKLALPPIKTNENVFAPTPFDARFLSTRVNFRSTKQRYHSTRRSIANFSDKRTTFLQTMDQSKWDSATGLLQASIVVKPVNNGIMESFESVGKASNRGRERRNLALKSNRA